MGATPSPDLVLPQRSSQRPALVPSAVWGNTGDGGPFGNLVRGLELAGPKRAESLASYLACLTLGGISCVHVAIPVARISTMMDIDDI